MANTPTPAPIDLRDRVDARPAPVARPVTWPLTLADRRRGGAR